MERKEPAGKPSRLSELREKIGAALGRRPEWFDQSLWDSSTSAEKYMISQIHYRGKAAFTVLRSAETGLRNFSRSKDI